MQRLLLIPVGLTLVLALWLWGFGGTVQVSAWAAQGQRDVQNAMALALRGLRANEPGALWSLWTLCFAYGFFHAAGPGHGKLVIGGYGLAARVPMGRLAGLAVASSLAQAATAVLLVYAGVFVFGWNRERMQGLADTTMQSVSSLLIAGVGAWLCWRGLRAFGRVWKAERAATHHAHHAHKHAEDGACATCGHAHGPTPQQAAEVRSLRDALIVIGSVAVRPCTGALFLLILTWRIGIDWAGIVGAFVMGLGTASITLVVAAASVSLRESALAQVATGPAAARMLALIETLAGLMVLVIALHLLQRGL